MKSKTFKGKKIKIRKVYRKDLKNIRKFQNYINSLIQEEAKILFSEKVSLKHERDWLKRVF